jgi:hypothetical protein
MEVVPCLLFCGIKVALCELGRPYMAAWGNRCVRRKKGKL